jgi:hypothetical protein
MTEKNIQIKSFLRNGSRVKPHVRRRRIKATLEDKKTAQVAYTAAGIAATLGVSVLAYKSGVKRYRVGFKKSAGMAEKLSKNITPDKVKAKQKNIIFGIGGLSAVPETAEGKTMVVAAKRAFSNNKRGADFKGVPVANKSLNPRIGSDADKTDPRHVIQYFSQALKRGRNDSAIDLASQVIAYGDKYPDKQLVMLGNSSGGFAVQEAAELLRIARPDWEDRLVNISFGTEHFGVTKPFGKSLVINSRNDSAIKYLPWRKDAVNVDSVKSHSFFDYGSNKDVQSMVKKLIYGENNFNFQSTDYIEFKLNLAKGAVKVGAHLRNGKWIQGFKQTRNLAKKAATAQKAQKATTDLTGYIQDEALSAAALETARRGGSELAKKSNNRFVRTGELPNRAEAAQALGGKARSFATELIRNPRATIARGLQKEAEALQALTEEFGPPPITRGTVITKSLAPAKDQFAKKGQELLNNPGEFFKSELGQTWQIAKSDAAMGSYPAVGGFIGSKIGGAALGPAGGIAGDITGDLVTRKGIADVRGLVNAVRNRQSLPKLEPEFGVNERLQRFGQIIEDAKARSSAELTENRNKELADAFGGWIPGAGVGDILLGGAIPGAGVLPGMAGSIYAQAVEKRIRETGEDVATAATNYFRDKIKVGNAREQALREQIKDKWTRLLYLEASG